MRVFGVLSAWWLLVAGVQASELCEQVAGQSQYSTQLYQVVVNGSPQSDIAVFYRRPCGGLLVSENDVNSWRIHTHDVDAVWLDDKAFINLSDYPGARVNFNEQSQSLEIWVPPERFAPVRLDFSPPVAVTVDDGRWAGFLNWGVGATWGDQIQSREDNYLLELGALAPKGTLASTWVGFHSESTGFELFRVQTNYIQDSIEWRTRLTVGDYRTSPSAWGLTHQAAGIQLSRNYGVDPYFRTTPVSQMRVLLDNASAVSLSRYTFRRRGTEGWAPFFAYDQVLPAGELQILNLPEYQNGAYQLRVLDAYGNEGYARSKYFFSQGLIKSGLHDFSVDLGLRREGTSDRYDNLLLTAVDRYGVNDWFTIEPHLEAGEDNYAIGLRGLWSVPYLGVFSGTVARSDAIGSASGIQRGEFWSVGVENSYKHFAYAVGAEGAGRDFSRPYETFSNTSRKRYFSSFSFDVARHLGMSISYSANYQDGDATQRLLGVTARWELLRGRTLSISARDDFEDSEDIIVTAAISFPFSDVYSWLPGRKGSANFNNRFSELLRSRIRVVSELGGDTDASSRVNLSTGGGKNVDYWNANYGVDLFDLDSHVAAIGGGTQYAEGSVSYVHAPGRNVLAARASGGMFLTDDGLHFSRSASRGWALIKLGKAGAGMMVNGFKANSDGDVLVPNLPEYSETKLSLTAKGLPFNAQIDQYEFPVTPRYRNVSVIEAPIKIGININAQFVVPSNAGVKDIPAGAMGAIVGSTGRFIVGYGGLGYIEDAPVGESVVKISWRTGACTAIINVDNVQPMDEIPELGPFKCE